MINLIQLSPHTFRNILVFLLLILGIGALFGGGVLIISPSGNMFQMPLNLLRNSPFSDFLIPGLILFVVLGIWPVWVAISLIYRPKFSFVNLFNVYEDMYWAWTHTIYIAFALIIWIQVEMIYIQSLHWSHTFYMCNAIAIIFVALMQQVRSQFNITIK